MWSGGSSSPPNSAAPSRARILQSLQERKRSRSNSLSGQSDGPTTKQGDPRSYVPGSSHTGSSVVRGSQQVSPAVSSQHRASPTPLADPRIGAARGPGPRTEGPAGMAYSGSAMGAQHHSSDARMLHGQPPAGAPGPRASGNMNRYPLHQQAGLSDGRCPSPGPKPVQPVIRAPAAGALSLAGGSPHLVAQQQAAIQHAQSQSNGYYVVQDSLFGNLILPVLPRVENVK